MDVIYGNVISAKHLQDNASQLKHLGGCVTLKLSL